MSDEPRRPDDADPGTPMPFSDDPLNYPVRPEVVRERARRLAALAVECGEVVPNEPIAQTEPTESSAPKEDEEETLIRGDVDAAIRFFAAVDDTTSGAHQHSASDSDDPGIGDDAPPAVAEPSATLDFGRYRARRIRQRLMDLLETLARAIEQRDLQTVWDVLDEQEACRCFPPGIREEALVIARMPSTSFRAPVRLYRYYHLLRQLGDEPLSVGGDPRQLPLALEHVDDITGGAVRLEERRTSSPDRPRSGGGGDRRRSGSR